jgi:hypothetical protein
MEDDWKSFAARIDAILPTLATKADLSGLRADMEAMRADVARWTLATVIGLFIGFGGLFLAMSNSLKPSAPTGMQTQQPIVIVVPAPPAPPPASK